MDKIHLISVVTSPVDETDARFIGTRPSVIDVGTADGDLSFLFESVGCDVVAIDNSHSNYNRCVGVKSMRELLNSNIRIIERDIDYDFTVEGQFDLIVMADVLYHLRNPLGALIYMCQLGRYMVITTRIFEIVPGHSPTRNAPLAYLLAPFEAASNDPTNYWMFTAAGFSRLLNRSGWRILKSAYFGYSGSDSSPFDAKKDKRIVALCERVGGYERLKRGHFIPRELEDQPSDQPAPLGDHGATPDVSDHARATVGATAFQSSLEHQARETPEPDVSAERLRVAKLQMLLSDRDKVIRTMYASKSWQFTAPLRVASAIFRRSKNQAAGIVSTLLNRLR